MAVGKEDHCLHLAWSLQSRGIDELQTRAVTEMAACYRELS